MPYSSFRESLKNKDKKDLDLKIIKIKDATFILPKNASLRDINKFKEVKFAVMGGKSPIYAFFPKKDPANSRFRSHLDLISSIVKEKTKQNMTIENADKITENMIFGTYNTEKKEIIYCEKTNNCLDKKLKQSVTEILTAKSKKNIEQKKIQKMINRELIIKNNKNNSPRHGRKP